MATLNIATEKGCLRKFLLVICRFIHGGGIAKQSALALWESAGDCRVAALLAKMVRGVAAHRYVMGNAVHVIASIAKQSPYMSVTTLKLNIIS